MTKNTSAKPLNIIEAFQYRHSIRYYQGQNLTAEQKAFIEKIVEESNSYETPFHSQNLSQSLTKPGLGLLNVVTNEAGWIVQKFVQTNGPIEKLIIDLSFLGEIVVMKLAQNHIDTIWIADTYNETEAERRFPGFKVPSAIAYGIQQTTKQLVGKQMRFFGCLPGERLPFENIFYDSVNKWPISEKVLNSNTKYPSYLKPFLTALRSSPSAKNIQPWRFHIAKNEVHLFVINANKYALFDTGIALASLFLLAEIRGGKCSFVVKNPPPKPEPFTGDYIATAVYLQ